MRGGKAAGPDGLPIDIYKEFKDELISPLLDMYVEAFQQGCLPPSLRSALITLILKPGNSPVECGSYRSISLLNTDAKIIAKALGMRLEKVLPLLVHSDQNGFVKNRQGFHNVKTVRNLVHAGDDAPDTAILSLVDSTAEVLSNSRISQQFKLSRGSRQGSLLSPLLFVLSMELLVIAIRSHPIIRGIHSDVLEHRIADDTIVFLSEFEKSIPSLLQLMGLFGDFSGFRVNKEKSSIMFLNEQE